MISREKPFSVDCNRQVPFINRVRFNVYGKKRRSSLSKGERVSFFGFFIFLGKKKRLSLKMRSLKGFTKNLILDKVSGLNSKRIG